MGFLESGMRMYLCVLLICIFITVDATGVPRQFIESARLYGAGNYRALRNPDGSEKCRGTSQFFRRSDSIGRKLGGPVLNAGEPIRGPRRILASKGAL